MKTLVILCAAISLFVNCNQATNKLPEKQKATTVLLDAGHGGKDPGAVYKNTQEKDINLMYVKLIEKKLKEKNINVQLTRCSDEFISLQDRIQNINSLDIDLLVSIHINSSENLNDNGFNSYYKENSSKSALLDSIVHSNINESNILKDNGSSSPNFYVLISSPSPSLMISLGYLSNEEDNIKIADQSIQDKLASAIAESIKEYFSVI